MAAPLFPMKSILSILPILLIIGTSSAEKKKLYEIPAATSMNSTYIVSPFSAKTFVRTSDFELNSTSCVQFSFRLRERRVKLHAYTCLVSEGGFCTLDKFSFPLDREGCTYLRPWSHKVDTWSFYFVLERRPRKYGKAYQERQKLLKVKRQTSSKREMSTETVGELILYGVVPCTKVCGNEGDVKLGSKADGTFHRGRAHRLEY